MNDNSNLRQPRCACIAGTMYLDWRMRNVLIPPRRFDPRVQEMMDRPDGNPEVLRDDLRNLRIINKYFGGLRALRIHVVALFGAIEEANDIRILDLATGSADHPIALVNLAHRFGRRVRITGVDKNPVMLEVARERTKDIPEIRIEEANLLSLPFDAGSFDIVLCSLVLHHFAFEQIVQLVRNIHRIARVGWIVQDLNRNWPAAWTAWLYTHLTTRNPMTLYDSYVSVLRGFTRDELMGIAREAGINNFTVTTHPFFRLVMTGGISK